MSTTDADCNMGCAGNTTYVHSLIYIVIVLSSYLHSEACGGPNRVSVYSSVPVVALPVPVTQKTDLPGKWNYAGCLREPATGKIFPNQIIWIGNNSAVACMNQCAAFGYPASGVEVSYKPITKDLNLIFNIFAFMSSLVKSAVRVNTSCRSHKSLNDY